MAKNKIDLITADRNALALYLTGENVDYFPSDPTEKLRELAQSVQDGTYAPAGETPQATPGVDLNPLWIKIGEQANTILALQEEIAALRTDISDLQHAITPVQPIQS